MCPDYQILSIYFDAELDSPWNEKLEKHLENCPSCRERFEAYRITRQKLYETSLNQDTVEQAMERVWAKTDFRSKPKRRLWATSISVPVPVAAAAGLIMVLAMAALIVLRQPVVIPDHQLAGMEMQEIIPVPDMASFFQYLGSDNSTEMVIIRLPDTTFIDAGEPQMLRAADYSRSVTPHRNGRSR
ncbi:MAG: hypothetical protein LBH07_01895 [Treponema sp.]|jgi:hypothetical protein|nr:hypothetical protein [Treponema sp.]